MPRNNRVVRYGAPERVKGAYEHYHETEAIVLSCLDPRYLLQVLQYFFIQRKMPVDAFSFPGNMQLLNERYGRTSMLKGSLEWMRDMKAAHKPKRIIYLIHAHVCGAYKIVGTEQRLLTPGADKETLAREIRELQLDDMEFFRDEIAAKEFPDMPVEFYEVSVNPETDETAFTPVYIEAGQEQAQAA